ncbi:unnamed protein product, partial [Ectocarpus sp. 13 AM-2016]
CVRISHITRCKCPRISGKQETGGVAGGLRILEDHTPNVLGPLELKLSFPRDNRLIRAKKHPLHARFTPDPIGRTLNGVLHYFTDAWSLADVSHRLMLLHG